MINSTARKKADKNVSPDKYSFRWGVPELDGGGGVYVSGWMLRNYAEAGIKPVEFLTVIHVSAYHYESERGRARPSLATIARQMGFAHKNSVYRILKGLADPQRAGGPLLDIIQRPGLPCEYNAHRFARRLMEIEQRRIAAATQATTTTPAPDPARELFPGALSSVSNCNAPKTPEPHAPEKQAPATTRQITDKYCDLLGYDPGDWAAGESAAAKKIAAKWTADQLAEVYKYYKPQPFWTDKRLRLASLKDMIPEYFRAKAAGKLRPVASGPGGQSNTLSALQMARQKREGAANGIK